jgi:GNAT superfamily N-acetyltransferase
MDGPRTGAPKTRVRAARRDDLPRIWEMLLGLADYERLRDEVVGTQELLGEHLFGARPLVECLVAETAAGLVGYALFYPRYSSFQTAPTLWLEDLFVEPAQRGVGAGKALMLELARLALNRGYGRVAWVVLNWNEPSIAFYRRAGGKPAGVEWTEYGMDGEALRALAESAPILEEQ